MGVERWRTVDSTRIRYLDREVRIQKSVLRDLTIPGKKLEIMIDGQLVQDLSSITVALSNFTDQNFENVPIYIKIEPTAATPVQVVSEHIVGNNNLPEGVVKLTNVQPSQVPGGLRYGYQLGAVNRSDKDTSFRATYFILGATEPTVSVKVHKSGLDLRDFSIARLQKKWSWENIIISLILLALITAIITSLFLGHRWARNWYQTVDAAIIKGLTDALTKPGTQEEFQIGSDVQAEKLARSLNAVVTLVN
jgi:hypothetical protein